MKTRPGSRLRTSRASVLQTTSLLKVLRTSRSLVRVCCVRKFIAMVVCLVTMQGAPLQIVVLHMQVLQCALQVCADDVPSMPRIGSSHVCFSLKQSIGLYHGQELHSLPSPLFQIMCSRPAVGCACLISPEMRNIPAWQRRCLSAGCVALAAAGSLRGPGSRVVAGWK